MSISSKTASKDLATKLANDYKQFKFIAGKTAMYSASDNTITYRKNGSKKDDWTLLHELAHGVLNHNSYSTDFELLKLESQAWHKAKEIGKKYDIKISEDHIQNCLDTYRDWLHRRSACPTCNLRSVQINPTTYKCLNCKTEWKVKSDRFVRPYRLKSL